MTEPYLTPRGLLAGNAARAAIAAGAAWPLLGQERAFALLEVTQPGAPTRFLTPAQADRIDVAVATRIAALAAPCAPFCGLDLRDPVVMGIVNVTPDSFSDGGRFQTTEAAIAHGHALAEAGAAIIDVGGESTRPGSAPVDEAQEIARAIPVITALAARGLRVSIDSRHGRVVAAALQAGAGIVNDITALADPESAAMVARAKAGVVLMHMQGEPRTMQANPTYVWAPGDVSDALAARIAAVRSAGIAPACIAVDPGLGFGKTAVHNAQILDHSALFHGLGCALVVGASRKSFIAAASRGESADERLPGSLACALHAWTQGAQILRVHDVAETRQALAIARKITIAPDSNTGP